MSADHLPQGLPLRRAAAHRLADVLAGHPFTPFAEAELADPRARALANKLVTTALRRHGQIVALLANHLERGLPKRSGLFAATAHLAIAELLFAEGGADHSAVNLAVELVRRDRRASRYAGLMNALLRSIQRDADGARRIGTDRLLPDWLAARWTKAYGADALPRFTDALLAGAPLDLTLKAPDPALAAKLNGQPVIGHTLRLNHRDRPVIALPGFAEGRWWVQDVAATLPARLLDPGPGLRVLDSCAAPGGKTAQLAATGASVTALDIDQSRLERLRANLDRLGLTADLVQADAADFRPTQPFDAVLLDAPCSATGTFRRHPEVLWTRDASGIAGRAALQKRLLAATIDQLAPGGTLVFCTCSLEPEEGEEIARWAIGNQPLAPRPVTVADLPELPAAVTGEGFVRTHPALDAPGPAGGTLDGFFIARFVKTG